jgi:RNA polymerase sigma-70 factor, ECF subfamily
LNHNASIDRAVFYVTINIMARRKKSVSLLEPEIQDQDVSNLAGGDSRADEEILFASVKKPALFENIVARYEEAFKRKVRVIIGMRDEVDDVVQEAFVKIYLNAHRFQVQEGASFKSWAYKILLNTTFTHYQKLKKIDGATVKVEQEVYESFADKDVPDFEEYEFVSSVLCRMPKHLGKVLKLHFLDGMPQKEIAVLEGVSVSAIKTRIHRAKKEFKKINSSINQP